MQSCVTGLERQGPVAPDVCSIVPATFPSTWFIFSTVCGSPSAGHTEPFPVSTGSCCFPCWGICCFSFTYPHSGLSDGPFSHRKPHWPVQPAEFFDLCGTDYLPWDLTAYAHGKVLSYFMYLLPFQHNCVPFMNRTMLCSRLSAQGQAVY